MEIDPERIGKVVKYVWEEEEYNDFVEGLAKPGSTIKEDIDSHSLNLWHAATGIATEAGEILSTVKKTAIYGAAVDYDNLIEELGDLEFYMAQLRMAVNVKRWEVIGRNMDKLRARYPKGYTNQAARERADKTDSKN